MEFYSSEEIKAQRSIREGYKKAAWAVSALAALFCVILFLRVNPLNEGRFRIMACIAASLAGCFDIYVASFIMPYLRPKTDDRTLGRRILRVLSNILHQTHMYAICIIVLSLIISFIFNALTDAAPEKKIEIYIDAPKIDEAQLEYELDKELPEGIKLVKVHPFDYDMFGSHQEGRADIYVLKASDIEEYLEGFAPLEEVTGFSRLELFATDFTPVFDVDGVPYGYRVPAGFSDEAAVSGTDYVLCFGKNGLHQGRGGAAFKAAVRFTELMYERSLESLRKSFILGMDASSVPSEEASGVKYYDFEGKEQDVFRILADCGINYIRVRIWNDPWVRDGNGYGGGNCDIDTAVSIGKRAAACGMKLLADFHYSDFWADPGKQQAPKAWQGLDLDSKADALYKYTRESLEKLKKAGVDVGMVQIGNETSGALCGEKDWENICRLMNSGSGAVRELFPEALVALHFTNPEHASTIKSYAFMAEQYAVDYDVFGVSYYPFWHGTLENLSEVLSYINERYGKRVMVLETSYAYTPEDTDFSPNTISASSDVARPYPYTVQGQADSIRDVIQTVASVKGGIGVCYWEGCWIAVPGGSKGANEWLWQANGSGWASSYAAEYDPEDAGKYYGGCAVDNQALFDAKGHPLESLKAFREALP